MSDSDRTLSIIGRFRDLIGPGMVAAAKQMAAYVAEVKATQAPFKAMAANAREVAKVLSAPIRVPVGWARGFVSEVLSAKNAVIGLVGVLAAKAGAESLRSIVRDAADVGRMARSLDTTAESISAIRFALQATGIEASNVRTVFNSLEKAISLAVRGKREKVTAFRDLGIDVRELQQLRPEELLARIARGLEKVDTRQRGFALQPLFEERFREFVPLLAQGEAHFRRLTQQAQEFGAVMGTREVEGAERFEQAMLRVKTAVEAVGRAAVIDIAREWAPGLEALAKKLVENRDLAKDLAKALGSGVATAIDLAVQAVIGLIRTIEKIPGFSLLDEEKTKRQIADLKRRLAEVSLDAFTTERAAELDRLRMMTTARPGLGVFGGADARVALREELERINQGLRGAAVQQRPGFRGAVGQETFDRFSTIQFLGKDEEAAARIRQEIADLQAAMTDGLAGLMEKTRQQMLATVAVARRELDMAGFVGPVDPELIRRQVEEAKQIAAEAVGPPIPIVTAVETGFDQRRRIAEEKDVLRLQQAMLQLQPQTIAVRDELARVGAELQKNAVLAGEFGENLTDVQESEALLALEANLERVRQSLRLAGELEANQFRQQLLSLSVPTEEVRREMAELQAEAQRLDFERAFAEGRIEAEDLDEALQAVDRSVAQTAQTIEIDAVEATLQWRREMVALRDDSIATVQELAAIDGELRALAARRAGIEGRVSPAEAAAREAAERERALRDARRYTTAGIWDGFLAGAKEAEKAWQDFAAVGQAAAGAVSNSMSTALDTLVDIQLGLRDSSAWKDWGRTALRELLRIYYQMLAMYVIKQLLGAWGGPSGGAGYGAGAGNINVSPPPSAILGSASGFGGGGMGGGRQFRLQGAGGGGLGPSGFGGGPWLAGVRGGAAAMAAPATIIEHHVHYDITAMDGTDVDRLLTRRRDTLARLQVEALDSFIESRSAVKRVAGAR